MIEAALLVCPESLQRRGSITFVGRALGLKIVDADLCGRVHVPTGLGEDRRHVTRRALRLAVEHDLRRVPPQRDRNYPPARPAQESQVDRSEAPEALRVIRSGLLRTLPKPSRAAIGNFARVVQTRIVKRSLPVHLEIRDERVPVCDRSPAGPGVEIDAGESKGRRKQRRR